MTTTPNMTQHLSGALPVASVDLDAIADNVAVLRERAGSAAVMTVVKADGYGHGATEVARAALDAGAAELGVATVAEAVHLRQAGITAPVLGSGCWPACIALVCRPRKVLSFLYSLLSNGFLLF